MNKEMEGDKERESEMESQRGLNEMKSAVSTHAYIFYDISTHTHNNQVVSSYSQPHNSVHILRKSVH